MSASGNLCVWNALNIGSGGTTTLTEGNLKCSMTGADPRTTGTIGGTCADANGWYFEIEATNIGDGSLTVGIVNDIRNALCEGGQIHSRADSYMWRSYDSGQFFNGATTVTSYGAFANGDILSFYIKSDKLYVYKNNSAVVGNVSTGTSGLSIGGTFFFPAVSRTVGGGGTSICVLRPNSDSWSYTPPTGFKGLTAKDLILAEEVDPAEDNGSNKYHDTVIYTGDGGTSTSITGLNFQPDWILIKNRDQADDWCNQNSVTGVGKVNTWNSAGGYSDETDCITAFNSDGWTMNNDHKVNANTEKYVAYCWKKSADAGFDIVEYSGTGTTNNVSHSLGAEPDCIMVTLKSGSNWDSTMYFNSANMGSTEGIFMTLANGKQTTTYFPSVTSTTFRPDTSANTSTRTYVAYLFRSIPGFSHFGEYEGNSSADGPFIYTGFRPKFVFIKAIDATENWQIRDTARQTYNDGTANRIYWNTSAAEGTDSTASPIDFLANGFKIRGTNSEVNSNTIIYGAWGDVPYKYNNTRA